MPNFRIVFIVGMLIVVAAGLIRLRKETSFIFAVGIIWPRGTILPRLQGSHGRGWVTMHNGNPVSLREMATAINVDVAAEWEKR